MPQLRYELIGDASGFRKSVRSAASASEVLDTSLREVHDAVARLTEGNIQLRDEQGRFVSTAREAANASEVQAAALRELNAEGIETTQQVREQIDRLDQLQRIYAGDAKASRELAEQQQRLQLELAEVGASAAQQNQDLTRLDQQFEQATVAMTGFANRQERLQQELLSTAAAQDRVQSSGITMRSSVSASANNLGFEFVQAAQDARFGMAGVANQIPLMSEQFSQLTAKTGSTTGALYALGGSLLGTVGVVGGITLALQWLPDLISGFGDAEEAAEDTEAEFRGLFDTTDRGIQGIEELAGALADIDPRATTAATAMRLLGEGARTAFPGVAAFVDEVQGMGEVESTVISLLNPFADLNAQLEVFGAIWESAEVRETTENLRTALQQDGRAAQFLRIQMRALSADLETIVGPNIEAAREEVASLGDELSTIIGAPGEAIRQDPAAAAQQMRRELQTVTQQAMRQMAVPGFGQQEMLERRRDFLQSALEQIAGELSPAQIQQNFGGLLDLLDRLNARLEETSDNAEELSLDFQGIDLGDFGMFEAPAPRVVPPSELIRTDLLPSEEATDQIRVINNLVEVELIPRLQGARRQTEAIRSAIEGAFREDFSPSSQEVQVLLDRLIAAREQTRQIKAEQRATLQIMREMGFLQERMSLQEALTGPTGEAGDNIDEDVNRQLEQGIQLASQLGATLIQAAQQGGASFSQVFGSILQTVGSLVGLGNPVAGSAITGAGTVISALQHGGRVDTPFQLVGEQGPELAMLPQGTRVHSNPATERLLANRSVTVNLQTEVKRMNSRELGLLIRNNDSRRDQFGYTSG